MASLKYGIYAIFAIFAIFVGRVREKQMASLKYGMRHFSWQRPFWANAKWPEQKNINITQIGTNKTGKEIDWYKTHITVVCVIHHLLHIAIYAIFLVGHFFSI